MKSMRLRLLLSLLAMLAVAALVLGGVTYRSVLAQTETLFDYQLRQMALTLRDQGEIPADQATALADEQLDFVVQIWTVDGRSIYASRRHVALPARALLGLAEVDVEGQVWRTYSVATRDRVIQVAQPLHIRRRLAASAALHSVAPLAPLAPLLAVVMGWFAAQTLRPLQRLVAEVRARDLQSLSPLSTHHLPDELLPLVTALNGLLQRLHVSLDAQRAFVADAAHELRSPLTALKLQLQLLHRASNDTERAAAIAGLESGTERAARLIEQLLTLARTEPDAPRAATQSIDLSQLAAQALADIHPWAQARSTSIALHADAPVVVQGDPTALLALIRNLIDNAVRHSPPRSQVEVRVHTDSENAVLQVDDSGPGIAPDERARVFDRFYRRAPQGEEGTGLGLAIVEGVALRHGAEVTLGDSPLGGLRVSVRFPNIGAS